MTTRAKLDSPIDVMYLIHRALRAEAVRLEHMVEQLKPEEPLQLVREAFQRWARALGYHAEAEDRAMTAPLTDAPPARDNEVAHRRLAEGLEALHRYLSAEVGPTLGSARAQRQLYGRVVALRIAQDDHLEEEEEFVLPLVRQRIPEAQQLEMARQLLVEAGARDRGWIIDWVAAQAAEGERRWLADLVAHLGGLPADASRR
jgi:hemerythrin-like domain-containing protein